MPSGMRGIQGVVQDIEARKSMGGEGGRRLWFRLSDGESATVRFLEQGEAVQWAWCHDVPIEGKNYGRPVPCRDQDDTGAAIGERCPGCENRLPRKFKGWINLVWRGAPVFAKEANGRFKMDAQNRPVVESYEDQVAVWNTGITVFEELDGKDVTYKGLTSRDFKITRRGSGMATKYNIEPADPDSGPVALTANDKKLEGEKYDLTGDVTPPSYETWGKSQVSQEAGQRPNVPTDVSPFMQGRS